MSRLEAGACAALSVDKYKLTLIYSTSSSSYLLMRCNSSHHVSRATLSYALQELQIDVEKQLKELKVSEEERSRIREATKFGIFVVHNKYVPSPLRRTRLGSIR